MNEESKDYIKKRMERFKCHEEYGIVTYTWATGLFPKSLEPELPSGFKVIPKLQFPHVCAWAHFEESLLLTWRSVSVEKNFVCVYKFDNHNVFLGEIGTMIKNPKPWLEAFDKEGPL